MTPKREIKKKKQKKKKQTKGKEGQENVILWIMTCVQGKKESFNHCSVKTSILPFFFQNLIKKIKYYLLLIKV